MSRCCGNKVRFVKRDDCLRVTIYRSSQDHFIVRIVEQRSSLLMDRHQFSNSTECIEKFFDVLNHEPGSKQMLWPCQNRFILYDKGI